MTNGDESSMNRHFSCDEVWILQADILFLVINGIIATVATFFARRLRAQQLFHATFKLFLASLAVRLLALIVSVGVGNAYSTSGVKNDAGIIAADILFMFSTLIFTLLTILMGKGFTVTRGKLSHTGSIKITVFTLT